MYVHTHSLTCLQQRIKSEIDLQESQAKEKLNKGELPPNARGLAGPSMGLGINIAESAALKYVDHELLMR